MNNKDQRDTMEVAADWCDRLEQLSDAERQELKLWRAEPDQARAFDRVRRTMLDVALLEAAGDGILLGACDHDLRAPGLRDAKRAEHERERGGARRERPCSRCPARPALPRPARW